MTRMLKALALLAVLSLVAGLLLACGEDEDIANGNQGGSQPTATVTPPPPTPTPTTPPAPSPTTTPDRIDHPTGKDEVIVRIGFEGGFVMPHYELTRMPYFVLDGRGCVITQGPMIEIYPQPALPNLLETCLQEEGVQYILAAAKEAGLLDGDAHYPVDMIADAATSVFVVNADGKQVRVTAYALGDGEDLDDVLPAEEIQARARLIEFSARMGDLQSWLPPNVFESVEQPYDIERMQLVFLPSSSPSAPYVADEMEQQEIAWPLSGSLGEFGDEYFTGEYRCGVVEGEELATVLEELQAANQLTLWISGDESYYLFPLPLFGDDAGCPGSEM